MNDLILRKIRAAHARMDAAETTLENALEEVSQARWAITEVLKLAEHDNTVRTLPTPQTASGE